MGTYQEGPRRLWGWESCVRGGGRSPGPGGNSNYGVLDKMFCYLPWLTPLCFRTRAAKEKSQIQRLTQSLMWALRRFHGMRARLSFGERRARNVGVPCAVIGGCWFESSLICMAERLVSALFPTRDYLPSHFQARNCAINKVT